MLDEDFTKETPPLSFEATRTQHEKRDRGGRMAALEKLKVSIDRWTQLCFIIILKKRSERRTFF
jgi:hypothetical protein